MDNDTTSCTMCGDGTMQNEGDKKVCGKCGHVIEANEPEVEETDSAM